MDSKVQTALTTKPQTHFFQACRGVFEGGGCRGAAHVGAYQAAIECGVNFVEVAGTSAGSIITVLIAAGATPQYLHDACAYLKFGDLLSQPTGSIATHWFARLLGPFFANRKNLLGRIITRGSAYSSEKIQEWMDDRLAELLPNADRPIKFKSLILPTWVVATDLSGRRPKIWSTEETPDESVALAVRCSCSIPLFFEPVALGNDLYVDGGMLSNLPSFVFSDPTRNPAALGGPILAFQLTGKQNHAVESNIGWLLNRLIDTAISGATQIQKSMKTNISVVEIRTGDASSTNFDITSAEVESLLSAGRSAVMSFIANEHSYLSSNLAVDIARYSEDEIFDDLVREMVIPGKRLLVSCMDTKWFWVLFPSVVHWMFAGCSVAILISRGEHSPRELQRQQSLEKLGIPIVETEALPFVGFFLSRTDDRNNAAFILNVTDTQYAPYGSVYVGAQHRPVLDSLLTTLNRSLGNSPPVSARLVLKAGDVSKLVGLLKQGVNQYRHPDVQIEMRQMSMEEINKSARLIVRRIRSYKYRQIPFLVELYRNFNIPFGEPAEIWCGTEYVSTITPPVFEKWGDTLVAIEGNTRLYYLTKTNASSLSALVVSGVSAALPGWPVECREALLSTYQISSAERINGFNYNNFRSIEGAVRPTD